ncbi:MAG: helix-turn-helix transcriptional regulator [Oscillospiraceae bacterium]|nr:helix-turn-helix transcriptional regulator [Oscillospiraceae bacterium]
MKIEQTFGEYIKELRQTKGQSLRQTAYAIEVSPQFYSNVERGCKSSLAAEKLELLRKFLNLSTEESETMYNKAAQASKRSGVTVPQDFSDYIVERDYAMAALRIAKELNADEKDWQKFVDELKVRKEQEQ